MRISSRIFDHGLTVFIGVIAGVCYERSNLFSQNNFLLHATALDRNPPNFLPIPSPSDTSSKRSSMIMKYGFPSFENVKNYNNFVVSYDKRTRNANWVIEHLNETTLDKPNDKPVSRSGMEFFSDTSIHPYWRSDNDDFKRSGYDRGHLAAAGNHPSNYEEMNRTFVLSNISPQVGQGFNRDMWNVLETYVRYRAKRSKNLWVCTGPLFLAKEEGNGKKYVHYEVIGKNQVAVPTHFFKILLIELTDGKFELENYVMENTRIKNDTPLRNFQVPLDVIERSAGFLVFDSHPQKSQLIQNNPRNKFLEEFKFQKRTFDKSTHKNSGRLEPAPPAA